MIAEQSFDFVAFNKGHQHMLDLPYDTQQDILGLQERLPGMFQAEQTPQAREPVEFG